MKTDFLKELGLEQETIDKIMAENGKDIKAEQAKLSAAELERDNYKEQLDTAQEALKGFDGVNVEELKGQIQTLTDDLATKESDYQTKLSDMTFSSSLEKAIGTSKARNSKAVMGLLDIEALKGSKNQEADIMAAIEAIKADNDYLFESAEPIKNPVAQTGGKKPEVDSETSLLRSVMGLTDKEKE